MTATAGQPAPDFSLADDTGATVWTDLGFVSIDHGVECGRIDVALLGQDGFERAHPQLQVRELRAVLMVMVMHGPF